MLQISEFGEGETIRSVMTQLSIGRTWPRAIAPTRIAEILGRARVYGPGCRGSEACRVAGESGWQSSRRWCRRRIFCCSDEPTNHLDLAGIQWLESVLQNGAFACVVVSHDRYFLENVANEVVELNPAYEDGALRVSGNYSTFLEKKEEYLHAQRNRQEALENRVHTEIEWLRRGPEGADDQIESADR